MKYGLLTAWITGMIVAPGSVVGQAVLSGRVVDTAGNSLSGVEVLIGASAPVATSGANGTFHVRNIGIGEQVFVFRLVGYDPQELRRTFREGDSIAVEVVMRSGVQRLPDITTEANKTTVSPRMAGYHERKQLGFGTFIGDSLLRSREHSALSDVLRRVSGLTLTYLPSGGGLAVQMSRAGTTSTCPMMSPQCGPPGGLVSKRKDSRCFAQIYLDGIRVYAPGQNAGDSRGFSIDQFRVLNLQAIEIYKGPASTPAQYNLTGSACGTVLLWTRDR
jgi:hypothetical protein